MPSSLPAQAQDHAQVQATVQTTPAAPRRALPDWAREPLLHFMLLGGLLFAADHLLSRRADDPQRIIMDSAVDAEASQVFSASRGRAPDAKELAALRQVWLDNEVLYREGLALQVDKGDSGIRERVIFKALSVVEANLKLPAVNDKILQDWFNSHRDKYEEPARFDFQEALLTGNDGAPASEAQVRAFVAALNGGTPGDAKAGLRVFKGRPEANLQQSYGPDFAKNLAEGPVGEWRALASREGWRAIRLDGLSAAKAADFQALRNVVQQDWTDATMSEQRSAAVQALAKKYKIVTEQAAKP